MLCFPLPAEFADFDRSRYPFEGQQQSDFR